MMRFTTGDILIRKAHRGKLQEVVYLVQDIFVDVNYRNQSGQTALHYAAFYGHLEVVLALVEHGIPLNLKDKFGRTPHIAAALNGHLDVVKFLVEEWVQPIDINSIDENGKNAMHWAAGSGHLSTLRILAESFDLWTDAWEKGNAEYALPDDDVGAFKPRDQQRSSPNGPLSQNRGIVIATTSGLRHSQRHMYIDIMSVRNWLKQLELGEYTESFEKDGFDTLRGVATIDEGDLIEMNVKKGHRRGILQHIEDLKNQLAAFDDQAQLSGVEPDALPTLSMLPQLVKTPSATQLQALMNQSASINIPPPSVSSGPMDYTNSN
ncbi:hypothetical protein DYB37_003308 [Aphanomyces astaci]|uniref:SAM domain-containing protein n=1 Tax=Aphanomyces astaci TaxID=112090 RepID=A0A3R7BC00_APHAT|nr:hypothetical protein DYB37_003308 [Aphanomyces astaci]